MNQPQVRKGGILVAVASAIIYSGVSVLAKFAYRYNLSPVQLLKERYLLASIILVVIIGLLNWHLLFPRNWHEAGVLLGFSAVFVTGPTLLYFTALRLLPVSTAMFLFHCYPAFAGLFAWIFLHERVTRGYLASVGVIAVGLLLLLGASFHSVSGIGILTMLACTVAYALYAVLSQRVIRGVDPRTLGLYNQVAPAMVLCLLTIGQPVFYPAVFSSRTAMLVFAGIGLSAAGGMFLFVQGIAMIGAQRAVIIDSLEPVLSALYALVLLGERMKPVALIGGILIVAGVVIGNLPSTKHNVPSTLPSTTAQ
ncbi:DMT family transporter [Candidatus Cryosericum odellii]|jgi:drug/metabolite transporter (DMT)-like permease|uniref:DMT family transporter n=1 Tax=Candidatus Cryosericum odellii TaxID=2290917 RepID=A0A398D6W4_9BACT|nr:DMT family transporter [Candidatus Cryosericum odellii]RIE07201.1 DMT family transporter [Candidatus Cryosericum odellii]RIE08404.1 DMT family transporter [Candidatus Cryosericum odellii]